MKDKNYVETPSFSLTGSIGPNAKLSDIVFEGKSAKIVSYSEPTNSANAGTLTITGCPLSANEKLGAVRIARDLNVTIDDISNVSKLILEPHAELTVKNLNGTTFGNPTNETHEITFDTPVLGEEAK